jgi:hypothetical protein
MTTHVTLLGLTLLLMLTAITVRHGVSLEHSGFAQDCAGFAADVRLGHLWGRNAAPPQSDGMPSALAPRLSLQGMALATYSKAGTPQTASTVETLFGVSHDSRREIVETSFYQEARAVVLYPGVLATVAHALTPDVVEVRVGSQPSVYTVPLRVTSATLAAHTRPNDPGVQLHVAHVNESYDLALIQTSASQTLPSLPYAATLSYGSGDPRNPTGGIVAGDCVAAVVTVRDGDALDTGSDRLVVGKVLARVPVAINALTQTKLNVNMFTTDLPVVPGDSGSPVLALRNGKPVLIGLVSATMFPTATFTYVSRIDPLLALADALQHTDIFPSQSAQASYGAERVGLVGNAAPLPR